MIAARHGANGSSGDALFDFVQMLRLLSFNCSAVPQAASWCVAQAVEHMTNSDVRAHYCCYT